MSKILKLLLIFSFIASCTIRESAKFWKKKKIVLDQKIESNELFAKADTINVELNPDLRINLSERPINNSFLNNVKNNNGRINYKGNF